MSADALGAPADPQVEVQRLLAVEVVAADLVAALSEPRRGNASGRDRRLHHLVRALLWRARDEPALSIDELRQAIYSSTSGLTRVNLELARTLLTVDRPREAIDVRRVVDAWKSAGPPLREAVGLVGARLRALESGAR